MEKPNTADILEEKKDGKARKPYQKPQLKHLGSIVDKTKVDIHNFGTDNVYT